MRRYKSDSFWHGAALGCFALFLAAVLWGVIAQPPPVYGQVPDSGAQRLKMIEEIKTTNQKLTEIAGLLKEIRNLTSESLKERKTDDAPQRP